MSDLGKGQKLYIKARKLMPGGTQLLSKRPELFLPDQWPSYYSRAKGAEIWDLDGRRYLDFSIFGVGASVLGYADDDVNRAVIGAIEAGTMSTLNCPEEVELAELLVELHPWSQMVRFVRTGGEAMAVAVRIARAASGRDKVAFCGYHGWCDWYLAANLAEKATLDGHLLRGLDPAGVPRGLVGSACAFRYNAIEEFRAVVEQHGSELGVIVMEPRRSHEPAPGFLEEIRETASRIGAVLIFDEVTSGWRRNTGGIHLTYGVEPDLAVFAKAMGNGYPIGAVIGIAPVMEAAQVSFISSAFWTEKVGPTAALAMIRKHRENNVGGHLTEAGRQVQAGWQAAAEAAGLRIKVDGIEPLSHFDFDCYHPAAAMTLFTQMMLDRGFLASSLFYASYAHKPELIAQYVNTVHEVFGEIAKAVAAENVEQQLRGPVKHSGFQRLT